MPNKTELTSPLFRAESMARAGMEGEIVLARPVSHAALAGLFILIAIGVFAFLGLSTYTRKASAPGVLLPTEGLVRVVANQGGLVAALSMHEGRKVQAGDVLFSLTSERSNSNGSTTESTVSASLRARKESMQREKDQQLALQNQRIDAVRKRVVSIQAESSRIDAQIALQRQRIALADSTLTRTFELRASGFVSAVQVHEKQGELLDQRQRLAELERARAAAQRDSAAAMAEVGDLQIQAQRDSAALDRSIAAIDQDLAENEARRDTTIRASRNGVVTAVLVDTGQTVTQNQVLATIVPSNSSLEAELQVPSRSIGFVKPGMEVLLRYTAFPFQKFGHARGRVREISAAPVRSGDTPEPVYRIRVTLDKHTIAAYGQEQPLKPGTAVDASIYLETRSLYEWLLDPLLSVRGRL